MLFCNFLRINPHCSAKINRAQIHHFSYIVCDAILQVGQTVPNSEKKYNHQFKHRAAFNKLFEMATLIEHTGTARFLGSWKKYFQLFSGFSCSTWHGLKQSGEKAELVACAFLAVELKLPIIESSDKNSKKTMMQCNLGFKEKEVLNNSFVCSSFNYCPLVWDFCSSKKCIEKNTGTGT